MSKIGGMEEGKDEYELSNQKPEVPRRRKYNEEDTIRILLVGKTGSGKSSTGNTIIGKHIFETVVSASSITEYCREDKIRRRGKNIQLVDTPGFFKTDMSIEVVKTKILECISMVAPGPHVILYVSKIGRCTDEEIQSLQHFRQLFPGNPYPFTIMLFTGSDYLQKTKDSEKTETEEKETLEMAYVGKLPLEFKKILQKCKQRKMFFNNNLRDPCSIDKQTESLLDLIEQVMDDNDYTFYQNDNTGDVKRDTKKWCTLKLIEYTSNLSIVFVFALMICGYVEPSWKLCGYVEPSLKLCRYHVEPIWKLCGYVEPSLKLCRYHVKPIWKLCGYVEPSWKLCRYVEPSWKLCGILIGIRVLVEVIKRRRPKYKESKFARVRNILHRDRSVCVVS